MTLRSSLQKEHLEYEFRLEQMTLPNSLQNLNLDDDFNQVRGTIIKQLFEVDVRDNNRNHQIDTFRGTIPFQSDKPQSTRAQKYIYKPHSHIDTQNYIFIYIYDDNNNIINNNDNNYTINNNNIYTPSHTHTPTYIYMYLHIYIHTHPPVSGCQVPQFGAALGWMAGGWFLGVGYLKYE